MFAWPGRCFAFLIALTPSVVHGQGVTAGTYALVNAQTGLCLELQKPYQDEETQLHECDQTLGQHWQVQPDGKRTGQFAIGVTDTGSKYLGVGNRVATTPLDLTPYQESDLDRWSFNSVSNGLQIVNEGSGLCATPLERKEGGQIVQDRCAMNNPSQVWVLRPLTAAANSD